MNIAYLLVDKDTILVRVVDLHILLKVEES